MKKLILCVLLISTVCLASCVEDSTIIAPSPEPGLGEMVDSDKEGSLIDDRSEEYNTTTTALMFESIDEILGDEIVYNEDFTAAFANEEGCQLIVVRDGNWDWDSNENWCIRKDFCYAVGPCGIQDIEFVRYQEGDEHPQKRDTHYYFDALRGEVYRLKAGGAAPSEGFLLFREEMKRKVNFLESGERMDASLLVEEKEQIEKSAGKKILSIRQLGNYENLQVYVVEYESEDEFHYADIVIRTEQGCVRASFSTGEDNGTYAWPGLDYVDIEDETIVRLLCAYEYCSETYLFVEWVSNTVIHILAMKFDGEQIILGDERISGRYIEGL